jgi:catechol 2,3-dioxygenase-like lactoylglutathione lyase family enzyme
MKVRSHRLTLAGFAACAALQAAPVAIAQSPPTAAARPVETRALQIRRPNLLVADLDRSLTIYRDVLAMPLSGPIATSKSTSYSYPVFAIPAGATMRFVYLTVGEKVRGFGLTEVKGAPLPRSTGTHGSGLVVEVNSVDAVLAKIRALKLPVVEPRLNPPSEGGALYEAAFTDYDGHLIVIYEIIRAPRP